MDIRAVRLVTGFLSPILFGLSITNGHPPRPKLFNKFLTLYKKAYMCISPFLSEECVGGLELTTSLIYYDNSSHTQVL